MLLLITLQVLLPSPLRVELRSELGLINIFVFPVCVLFNGLGLARAAKLYFSSNESKPIAYLYTSCLSYAMIIYYAVTTR